MPVVLKTAALLAVTNIFGPLAGKRAPRALDRFEELPALDPALQPEKRAGR